jgi:hypothetical protein
VSPILHASDCVCDRGADARITEHKVGDWIKVRCHPFDLTAEYLACKEHLGFRVVHMAGGEVAPTGLAAPVIAWLHWEAEVIR